MRRARIEETDWGNLPVVAEEDLVLLKRTNRPQDYAIISRLAMLRLARVEKPSRSLVKWVAANAFRAEDLAELVNRFGGLLRDDDGAAPKATKKLLALQRKGIPIEESSIAVAERELFRSIEGLMEAGRNYWIPRIHDLRKLRNSGRLWPDGASVSRFLAGER